MFSLHLALTQTLKRLGVPVQIPVLQDQGTLETSIFLTTLHFVLPHVEKQINFLQRLLLYEWTCFNELPFNRYVQILVVSMSLISVEKLVVIDH